MSIQYIEEKGRKAYAVVPIDDFEKMLAVAENAEDIRAVHESASEESFPQEFVEKLLKSASPLSVWREYRKLTQEQLHDASGISQGYITQIEKGKKTGSVETLKALAAALNCDIEDIIK